MARDFEIIETDRLLLRGINESDAEDIVEWRSDPEVYRFFKFPHKLSIEEHINWYRHHYINNENRLDWICLEKRTGKKIGVCGLFISDGSAEVNYLLSKDSQHKGYASEAVRNLIAYAENQRGIKSIIAEIHKDNIPSIRLVQKLGFKLKSDHDEFIIFCIGKGDCCDSHQSRC